MSTNEKNPFSRYFEIFYKNRAIKKGMSRRFMIYFLRSFAFDRHGIDNAILSIINSNNGDETNIEPDVVNIDKYLTKIKKDTELPYTFATYVAGTDRRLSEHIRSVCLPTNNNRSDVRTRIKDFLVLHISINANNEMVNQIKELFQELDVTEERQSELDHLVQEDKIIDYLKETFQLVLNAEYKKEESSSFKLDQIFEDILFNNEDTDLSDIQNKVSVELREYSALIKSNDIHAIEKALIEAFKRCVVKFHIDYFIKSDPNESLDPNLLNLIDYFVIIFEGILEMLDEYEQESIYDTIIRFKVALDQYKKYLCANMRLSPNNDNSWIPKSRRKKDKIDRMVISYRSWLATLYNKIYKGEECIII